MREGKPLKTRKEVDIMTKMTKKNAFTIAQEALSTIETAEATEAWNILQKEIERLERNALKAKSGERKMTKTQRENVALKEQIAGILANYENGIQAKEIAAEMGLSVQKISALCKQLVEEGAIVKTEGAKHVTLFALANEEEEVEG